MLAMSERFKRDWMKRVLQIAFYNPKSRNIEVRGIRDIAVRDEVGP